MVVSRIVLGLTLSAASLILAPAGFPGAALAGETADSEVVAASRTPKLPTEVDLAKARADNALKPVIKPMTTQEQVAAWTANAPPIVRNASATGSNMGPVDDATAKRQIHGEAGVSVGTGGFRSAYATSLIPVGETGVLGIAVSQTDFGKYGSRYGRDGYGYGRGQRGGTAQSIALSLDMTGDSQSRSDPLEGCARGSQNADRYIDPVWRGPRSCDITDRR